MSSTRLVRFFHGITVLFLVVAVLVAFRTSALPDTVVEPAGVDLPARTGMPSERLDPAVAATIIDASIFSDTRTPPATRYDPFEPAVTYDIPIPENTVAVETDEEAAVPRLFGTVLGPDGPRALMQLDENEPGAQMYSEGDRVGPYLVVRITEQSVILDTSEGRIVLRLFGSGGSTS